MTIQRSLAKTLLESIFQGFEPNARHPNTLELARYAGNATIVLGFEELTKQFASVLERFKFRSHKLDSLATNERQYPIFPENYTTRVIQNYYHKLLPCENIDFGQLLKEAKTESDGEDVVVSQAVLGRYDDAMVACQSLGDPYRQDHVRFIICIERYRRNHIQEAQAVHSTLSRRILTKYTGVQFALGICNRVPWRAYPYSDYY